MTTVLRITRHDLRMLLRNRRLMGSALLGLGTLLALALVSIRDGRGPEAANLLLFAFVAVGAGVPFSTALHSVLGEKGRGTIEPILLLPTGRSALIAGKALSAILLSLAGLVAVFAVTALGLAALVSPAALHLLLEPRTLYAALVLAPLSTVPFTLLALAISARSTDPQSASATSFLVLLPLWVVFLGVWMGWIAVGERFLLLSTLALVALALGAFRLTVLAFSGEALIRRRT